MYGLASINVELTSRCNKSCWMCGRRKIEKDYPHMAAAWGDMPLEMVRKIAWQIPPGVFVQLHNNGEPLLYPHLYGAIRAFAHTYTGLDTNGKLLLDKFEDLQLLDTITISMIPNDLEEEEQWGAICHFITYLEADPTKKPLVVFRYLGGVDKRTLRYKGMEMLEDWGHIVCHRVLHDPYGSRNYEKPVTIPEIGVCLEMLHKLSIDRYGNVSPCVRFDPDGEGVLYNISDRSLEDVWNSDKRAEMLHKHLTGRRGEIPFCSKCDYWGVPRG
jgi:radical SAM protein with 4Fe4S-binding SPASM domain